MGQIDIHVLASNFTSAYPSKMFRWVTEFGTPHGTVHAHNTLGGKEDVERKTLDAIAKRGGNAAIIGLSVRPDVEFVRHFLDRGVPVVLVDEEVDGASTVCCDNYMGGRLAGECLAKAGCKSPAIACGRRSIKGGMNAVLRMQGFCDAMNAAGVRVDSLPVYETPDYAYYDGIDAITMWSSQGLEIDGVFSAAGDVCASGMLRKLSELGLKVPDKVKIVGFDDMGNAAMSTPPLTTIRQPLEQMAREAVEVATTNAGMPPVRKVSRPSLVVRKSA